MGGLNAADLNFPDHFDHHTPAELTEILHKSGMALNGLAMRYYTDPGFRLGAFTHPDATVRRAAIDITKRGLDALAAMGGTVMTVWLGQDGFDYSFQGDYARMWDDTLTALIEVCDHNPALDISIEYKPNEPRSWSVLPDMATTLHAIRDVGPPQSRRDAGFLPHALCRRNARQIGPAGRPLLPHHGRPSERWLCQTR